MTKDQSDLKRGESMKKDYENLSGIVFNIQKFSLHDGPGIRTTVFLKGCPLKCPWCSNPESQNAEVELTWDHSKCVSCKRCTYVFDEGNVEFRENPYSPFINRQGEQAVLPRVTEERAEIFQKICPAGALSYEGKTMTVDEVMKEVLKDRPFYEESGGEVLQNHEFAIELLRAAKSHGIHTAAETTCLASDAIFDKFIQYVDVLLCDVKHWDDEKHHRIIGAGLKQIDRNIARAVDTDGVRVIGRIPVIPGFNFSEEDAKKLSKRMKRLGIEEVNLLPYHNFGENKYRLLMRSYPMATVDNLHKEDQKFQKYLKIFENEGMKVKAGG